MWPKAAIISAPPGGGRFQRRPPARFGRSAYPTKVSALSATPAGSTLFMARSAGLNAKSNQFFTQSTAGMTGGIATGDLFGTALAAGDFDANGFQDLAIGASGPNRRRQRRGGRSQCSVRHENRFEDHQQPVLECRYAQASKAPPMPTRSSARPWPLAISTAIADPTWPSVRRAKIFPGSRPGNQQCRRRACVVWQQCPSHGHQQSVLARKRHRHSAPRRPRAMHSAPFWPPVS